MKHTLLTVVFLALTGQAYGKNDWSKACLGGECSFDVEESPDSMGGSIQISGSSSAISDITPAAGWQILNCTNDTNNQTIRLACVDESQGCEHLFQNGAQNTVVRLPADCGSGPFVRVADHRISNDESLWPSLAQNLTKRDGTLPQVHELQVDDNFDQKTSPHGNIFFNITAHGNPRVVSRRRKRQTVPSGSASEDQSFTFSNTFSIFDNTLTCTDNGNSRNGQVSGNLELDATFDFTISLNAAGTTMPLSIFAFQYSAPTDASIKGSFDITANLEGSVNGVNLGLAGVSFSPLTIPGIATINPSFTISASPDGSIEDQPNLQTDVNFDIEINNLQFIYPTNFTPATVDVSRPGVPVSVSVSPSELATAQFGLTLTPELSVEITAFGLPGVVGVEYSVGFSMTMDANPSGNNVNACTNIENSLTLAISSTGALFAGLRAGDFTFFQDSNTMVNFCEEAELGPSPSIARRSESVLGKRDGDVDCPDPAATPLNPITFKVTAT